MARIIPAVCGLRGEASKKRQIEFGGETMRREITIRATRCFATTLLTVFAVGLLASAGWAEEDMRYHDLTTNVSTLELGTLFSSDDDFKFADFTGLGQGFETDGWSILGNVDLRRRSAFDAEHAYYYRIRGLNLGLDSRYIDAEYKMPGLFGISLFYDEMPKYQTDSAQTFMRGAGSGFLTLPPSWLSTSISDFDNFLYINEIDSQTQERGRRDLADPASNFDFDASYQRQTKRGEKLTAAGDRFQLDDRARTAGLHHPPDRLAHPLHGRRPPTPAPVLRVGLLQRPQQPHWQDPRPGRAPVGFASDGMGRKASAPDNWFHQVTASGGFDLPPIAGSC